MNLIVLFAGSEAAKLLSGGISDEVDDTFCVILLLSGFYALPLARLCGRRG
jgi:hypothetical protein